MKSGSIKFTVLVVFIVAGSAVAWHLSGTAGFDASALHARILSFGAWAPAIYILAYAVLPAFMFPGLALTIAGGLLFGPIFGLIYAVTGATLGALVAFTIARLMGREWVESRVLKAKSGIWRTLDARMEKEGWKVVAIARLIPVLPYNLLNYAFAITRIKTSHYVIATFIFMLPGAAAYVLLSSSIVELVSYGTWKTFIIGLLLVIAVSAVSFLFKKKQQGSASR